MRALKLTPQQADAAYTVLVLHAGANDDAADREAFVFHVAHPLRPCEEYRFCGALGWGGKFRNDGNNQGVPYVDFYAEHHTERRRIMAQETNFALRELFARVES
jgi:hypothetical protein